MAMVTVEIDESILGEVKALAKDFLDHALIDDPHYDGGHSEDLETIGLRMVETLFPKEYRKYFYDLLDAVKEDIAKEDKQ